MSNHMFVDEETEEYRLEIKFISIIVAVIVIIGKRQDFFYEGEEELNICIRLVGRCYLFWLLKNERYLNLMFLVLSFCYTFSANRQSSFTFP